MFFSAPTRMIDPDRTTDSRDQAAWLINLLSPKVFASGTPSMIQQLPRRAMIESHRLDTPSALSDFSLDVKVLDYTYLKFLEGKVAEGMGDLLPVLRAVRLRSGEAEWQAFVQQCLRHPLKEFVHQDPFTFRAFSKPRGYAGDAKLLDYIYGREEGWPIPEGTTEMGKQVFDFTINSNACEAVRARRGFIADLVDNIAEECDRPHLLSIASGHLREAMLCSMVKRRRFGRFVALDSDAQSLEEVSRFHGAQGVETCHASIRHLLVGKLDIGQFDLVYSTGLYDYLQLPAAQRLTASLFRFLRPRGKLLIANFLPGVLDLGYMESYMGWKLIFRTRQEMVQIAEEIPFSDIRDMRLFAEENQNIIFLQITRR